MSSFISWVSDFLMNRVLSILSKSTLLKIFNSRMLPKAAPDIEVVLRRLKEKIYNQKILHVVEGDLNLVKQLHVVGMVGLPQSGKTSVSESIASQTGFFHLNSNEIRGWLVDAGRDYSNINVVLLYSLQYLLVDEGLSVIVDSDCVVPVKRAFIEAIASQVNAKVTYVSVVTTYDVWFSRLTGLGYYIHRMYADSLRQANILPGIPVAIVPIEHVRKCVVSERLRQEPLHKKYLYSFELSGALRNDSSLLALQNKARNIAKVLIE